MAVFHFFQLRIRKRYSNCQSFKRKACACQAAPPHSWLSSDMSLSLSGTVYVMCSQPLHSNKRENTVVYYMNIMIKGCYEGTLLPLRQTEWYFAYFCIIYSKMTPFFPFVLQLSNDVLIPVKMNFIALVSRILIILILD